LRGFVWEARIAPGTIRFEWHVRREDGVVLVAQVQDQFEVLAENRMGDQSIASPVAVSNRLLIRGGRHLSCIAERLARLVKVAGRVPNEPFVNN
jgi:hypothetical protein